MPSTPQPLLRDVIEIPDAMTDSDFVLELASGVSDAESTLRDCVIPDALVDNFDEALGLHSSGSGDAAARTRPGALVRRAGPPRWPGVPLEGR